MEKIFPLSRKVELVEKLAAAEHERWSRWQRYLHQQCRRNSDGSLTIPYELVDRWERQIDTEYSKLSEVEKDSDREQVLKYLPLIDAVIGSSCSST